MNNQDHGWTMIGQIATEPSGDTLRPGQELLAQLLLAGYQVRVTAHGISMLPTLADGQQVLVSPMRNCAARRGDIVYVRRADQSHVLHRVVRTFPDGSLQTAGDAHWRLDDAVHASAVIGRVQNDRKSNAYGVALHALRRTTAICTATLAWSWLRYRYERLGTYLQA